MRHTGFIGGSLGYRILARIGPPFEFEGPPPAYRNRSKLEALFGPEIWQQLAGKVVIDFGCGTGEEAIEIAKRGARRVIGIDIQQRFLEIGRVEAEKAGVSDRCLFTAEAGEKGAVILSLDGFEHYGDPEEVLRGMRRRVEDDGRVLIAFGPPWLHPLGGHLFSVFPWAHLIFTEGALIRWRSHFKSDGARRFSEVAGGLNQMTIRRFRKIVARSDFEIEGFETLPIQKLRTFHNRLTEEFLTSVVRCRLRPHRIAPNRI